MPIPDDLQRLHNLVQISHSASSRHIIHSKIVTNDGEGSANWSLHIGSEKEWFEHEWREDELTEEGFLAEAGDSGWKTYVDRFERAFIAGEIHVLEASNGRECSLTVDNTSDSPIIIHLSRVSLNAKNENTRSLLFSLVSDVQKRGCRIGAEDNAQALENQRLEAELERFKRECERLQRMLATQSAAMLAMGDSASKGMAPIAVKPKTATKVHALKRKKGRSLVNPRAKKALPGDLEFEGDEDEDEDEEME